MINIFMANEDNRAKYTTIQRLFDYCIKIGIKAELKPMFDGWCIRFQGGGDFVQHFGSYGHDNDCVEPCIGCRIDYTAVSLKNAKALVRYHKDRLNKELLP
jgi:hypothetical protein